MTLGNFDIETIYYGGEFKYKISKMESVGNGNPSSSVLDSQSVNPTESSSSTTNTNTNTIKSKLGNTEFTNTTNQDSKITGVVHWK